MKKLILIAIALVSSTFAGQAQFLKIGIKAGPNFSSFNGNVSGIDYKSRTSFHAGAVAEIGVSKNLSVQPELLYSSQGADVNGASDFNLDYVSVPVLLKYYILSDKLSLDVGPQFSFLVKDADAAVNDKKFDFAAAGGVGLNITKSFFAQARYTIGLTDISPDAKVKNAVFQLSLGYMFF